MLTEFVTLVTKYYLIIDITQDDTRTSNYHSNGLADTILKSLNKPKMQKTIPSFILYDTLGLQLFDKITQSAEYYLTNAERSILLERADDLANRVKDGSIIFELGSGSLFKTQLILEALEKQQKRITYYALDLNRQELERSLSSLDTKFQYVQLIGLLGTYVQGMQWLKQHISTTGTQKLVLWLGSSIGNEKRNDRPKDESFTSKAYNDCTNREFILNGLNNVNRILGQSLFNPNDFVHESSYQTCHGRQATYYRAMKDVHLTYNQGKLFGDGKLIIPVDKDELIHVIYSHKFSDKEIVEMLNGAGLNLVCNWSDANNLYRLALTECPND